jgi:hypothetical protein
MWNWILNGGAKLFFALSLVFLCTVIYKFVRDIIRQYNKGALYDLQQEENKIHEANSNLSDDALIEQANKGLGLDSHSKDKAGDSGSV